jgi:hypothetical protein
MVKNPRVVFYHQRQEYLSSSGSGELTLYAQRQAQEAYVHRNNYTACMVVNSGILDGALNALFSYKGGPLSKYQFLHISSIYDRSHRTSLIQPRINLPT